MSRDISQRLMRLQQICRERGTPLTSQRRTVLETLLRRSDHPTADQVYHAVRKRNPEISRRTVYRILDSLVAWGLIRRVHHPGAVARFDAVIHRHHHLVCIRCDRIVDLEDANLDRIAMPKDKPHGFDVCDFSVQLMGTCPECRQKEAN